MWEIVFNFANFFYPSERKVCRNIVSFSHSLLTIGLIGFKFHYNLIQLSSVSYFVWDLVHMLQYRVEELYIYHHLVTIIFLFSWYEKEFIQKLLFTAEISNIPTYIVYHKLKLKKSCELEKKIQYIWFFIFRVCLFTRYVYLYYENNFLMNNLLGIYVLGIIWFLKMECVLSRK